MILTSGTRESNSSYFSENKAHKTNPIRFLALLIPNYVQNTKEIDFSTTAAKLKFCLIFTESRSYLVYLQRVVTTFLFTPGTGYVRRSYTVKSSTNHPFQLHEDIFIGKHDEAYTQFEMF